MSADQRQRQAEIDEGMVLGIGLLGDGAAIDRMADIVKPRDFSDPKRGRVWSAILEVQAAGQYPDPVTVGARVEGPNGLDMETLLYLAENVSSSVNCEHWAKRITDRARLRHLSRAAAVIAESAANADPSEADAAVNSAIEAMLAVDARAGEATTTTLAAAQRRVLARVRERMEGKAVQSDRLLSYLEALDAFARLRCGFLHLVGAASGHGKTAFMVYWAGAVARQAGVLYVTLEDPGDAIAVRSMGAMADKDMADFDDGFLTDGDLGRIAQSIVAFGSKRIVIHDAASATVADIERAYRKAARAVTEPGYPIKAVFVDYLQLVRAEGRHGNREQEQAEVADGLAAMAKRHNIAVVAAAQLNRGPAARSDKRPTTADLRESSRAEHNAVLVAFLYRPDIHEDTGERKTVEIIVRKNRGGRGLGTAKVFYDPARNRFADLAGDDGRRPQR